MQNDNTNWNDLNHAYGPATDVPNILQQLQSTAQTEWRPAVDHLYDTLCHQMISIYPATVAAIPVLLTVLDTNPESSGHILKFLADVGYAAHSEHLILDADADAEEEEDPQFITELIRSTGRALLSGTPRFTSLLKHANPEVRAMIPYLLNAVQECVRGTSGEPVSLSQIANGLRQAYSAEQNPLVRASLVFGLNGLDSDKAAVVEWTRTVLARSENSEEEQLAAILCILDHQSHDLPSYMDRISAFLSAQANTDDLFERSICDNQSRTEHVLPWGEDRRLQLPWPDQWPTRRVTLYMFSLLSRLEFLAGPEIQPAINTHLDMLDGVLGDLYLPPMLKFVFGDTPLPQPRSRNDLTPGQIETLRRIFSNLRLWSTDQPLAFVEELGVGESRQAWGEFLGEDSEIPNDALVQFLGLGEVQVDLVSEVNLPSIGTAAFLGELQRLPNLEILNLSRTLLSDADVVEIGKLVHLRELNLNHVAIGDRAVSAFTSLDRLERIYLGDTNVTDSGLKILERLKRLRYVYLVRSRVTVDGVAAFRDAYPECTVFS